MSFAVSPFEVFMARGTLQCDRSLVLTDALGLETLQSDLMLRNSEKS